QITSDQQQDHILFEMLPFETEHRRTPKNLEILPVPEIFCDKTSFLPGQYYLNFYKDSAPKFVR
ncbi:hypothetical protein, partial [Legionella sp.]|uniref:hypothetical protein n=1 Tax=Legionella sp. TaxID=459 RepID=UPI003C8D273C